MAIPSLALVPSDYKKNKLYSVLPNNEVGDFNFTRSEGKSTRINAQGLVEVADDDTPRLNYPLINGKVNECPSLLLEPNRTNHVLHSNDASQWQDIKGNNGTVIKTPNYALAPDGTQNATRLQASVTGTGYALIRLALTGAFSGNYTSTVYIKSNTNVNQDVVFYGRNTDFSKQTATQEWTRVKFKGSTTSGETNFAQIGINSGVSDNDRSIDILVWGGQLEQGSNETSLIPTSGNIQTRQQENCYGAGSADIFNSSEGVLYAEVNFKNADTNKGIGISDGTSSNRVLFWLPTSGTLRGYVFNGNGNTPIVDIRFEDFKNNLTSKLAIKYKQNDFSFWVNGVEIGTDTLGDVFVGGTLNQLSLAAIGEIYDKFFGDVKGLQVYNEALTDEELESLTSWDSFSDMATRQLYTLE